MQWITLILFVPACFALNMAPGPNNLLAMHNAKQYGLKVSVVAGMGRLLAFSLMIALAAAGLATLLYSSLWLFNVIKIIGASYLFYLAWQLWYSDVTDLGPSISSGLNLWQLARQEFLLAIGNPKAILIFTAFLPQFVDQNQPAEFQFAVLGSAFLLLEWLAITLYGVFGIYLRQWFSKPKSREVFNRSCAAMLAMAGVGLLFGRR